MKIQFFLAMIAAALPLAACVLETPSPASSPTPAQASSAGATLAPTQTPPAGASPTPAATMRAEPTPASGGAPIKQFMNVGGVNIPQYSNVPPLTIDVNSQYTATIRTNLGTMVIELFAEQAPVTVNNFIFLANDGFYNGGIFHRTIPSFMIQGGDPTGTGTAGPGYRFQDEFVAELTFAQPGILAMANSGPGTNGSQFLVTKAPTPHLNGAHTIFGQIIEGQDIADAISLTETGPGDRPTTPVVIQGIDIAKSP